MNNEVLVVIPTIIAHPKLYHLLDQLKLEPLVKQVIVVDNGNHFGIPEFKKETWSKVWHIRPGCNMNWLHSNNFGAAIALERKTPYVCFLNDDVKLSAPFFEPMIKTFKEHPRAGVVVPRYNGFFGDKAVHPIKHHEFVPEEKEVEVGWVDGTCMLIPNYTLRMVGFLDPMFKAPGWAADVDYSHRVSKAKLELYVSHRAMLWHHQRMGGFSAAKIHGSVPEWLRAGRKQARTDLEAKYGLYWRNVLPMPWDSFEDKNEL